MSSNHKAPLTAFVVVAIACVVVLATNSMRSYAKDAFRSFAAPVVAGLQLMEIQQGETLQPAEHDADQPEQSDHADKGGDEGTAIVAQAEPVAVAHASVLHLAHPAAHAAHHQGPHHVAPAVHHQPKPPAVPATPVPVAAPAPTTWSSHAWTGPSPVTDHAGHGWDHDNTGTPATVATPITMPSGHSTWHGNGGKHGDPTPTRTSSSSYSSSPTIGSHSYDGGDSGFGGFQTHGHGGTAPGHTRHSDPAPVRGPAATFAHGPAAFSHGPASFSHGSGAPGHSGDAFGHHGGGPGWY